ncbi:cbb3-type cytochrome c oxidase N-terminal domain-containing protein [Prosthecobacter sp.]|uniref:cbb3-type cytochrome c oxidase N-terminal domain-containing protein n=1 Tax=Prosthecobacter sp. TaxID=1965333 RepID=UPI0024895813|nr:cbb3-type cytochrome c oxidase N-terminal domain-containing protein [Prosthecobacter sp.]MDI1314201.1 cbb3-type cytochrome c oxidase N-terminal domain-containing protein [Prosthecobacter sp.]
MDSKQPSPTNEPVLREHVYDGIQEYDQKLPNWWLFTLYLAIAYFVIHWLCYYQLGLGSSDEMVIDQAIAEMQVARDKQMESITDEQLWALSRDTAAVEAGKATFMTQGMCVSCHGPDLSGTLGGAKLPGLPLSDKEWKHGGTPTEIFKIVRKGSPDVTKGMAAWELMLGMKRVSEVVAFVLSHHKEGEPVTRAADSPPLAAPAAAK